MNQKRSTPRYAHTEGHTDLCFSEDGRYIITCGSEGDIRVWNGIDDDDPKAVCVGEKAFAVAQKGGKLYVGSDHNNVQIYTFPEIELDGILTRFTAPVTTIDISSDGSYVAAGSSDMEIHLIEISTSEVKHFLGHKAPILHVAIDPKLDYLASSSCDGSVRIWAINDQKILKEWSNVITSSNSFKSAESLCHLSWEPLTGRLFAVPFGTEIKIFQRSSWNVMMTLFNNQSSKYSLTCWSSCGRYLAASTLDGQITVWNTLISSIVSSSVDDHCINICALRWNPQTNTKPQLAYCDANGQFAAVDDCYSDSCGSKVQSKLSENPFLNGNIEEEAEKYEDDDDPDAICLEKIKADYSGILDDENRSVKAHSDDDDSVSMKSGSTRGPVMPLVELQPSFQPTSTPTHLQRRFMVFNDVGYVRQTNTDEENVIDVDFHDASIHHAFRINNILNHSMAALSSEALVLACEKTEESSSKLVCRLLHAWDGSREWNTEMDDDENIEAIAVCKKWLAIATNLRYLRIFSLCGLQREIINVPGPVVCLNAAEDLLFVVYHSAMGLPGEQNLSFAVYQILVGVTVLVSAQPLPLSPKCTLKWVGFSDLLNPCSLDSDGILKLFVSSSGLWRPICPIDAEAKALSNHYFVIGVSEDRKNIRCILCKGSYYPPTTPHPFITEIPWQIPTCETTIEKGRIEEEYWRFSIARECVKVENATLNKGFLGKALQLIALACQSDREMRALELCEFTGQKDLTALALKYATKIRREKLVEKLVELQREQEREFELDYKLDESIKRDPMSYNDMEHENNHNRINGFEKQSQELFPETKNSVESTTNLAEESGNLILEAKRYKTLSEQKQQILGKKKINPFRKASQPVSELSSSSYEDANESSATPANERKKEINGLPSTSETKNNVSTTSFASWYELEKGNLMKEFPDLAEEELTLRAVKMYRNLTKSNLTSNKKTDGNADNSESTGTKRKSDHEFKNEESEKKKKAFFKLQGFAFKK